MMQAELIAVSCYLVTFLAERHNPSESEQSETIQGRKGGWDGGHVSSHAWGRKP